MEMDANEKKDIIKKINETAGKSSLVSATYSRTPKSPEEILESSGIDTVK